MNTVRECQRGTLSLLRQATSSLSERDVKQVIFTNSEEKGNDYYMAMRGIAARIQESYCFGTQAYAVTKLFGLNFCGPSNIVAPLGLRNDDTTYLAQARTHDREEVIVAELDLARLREFRAAHPRDFNVGLYEKYLPQAYAAYRAGYPRRKEEVGETDRG